MPRLPDTFLTAPIAHRGYHDRSAGRRENSLSAFRAAIAAGYGIELDVQPSSDGVPMVRSNSWLITAPGDGALTQSPSTSVMEPMVRR